MILISLGIALSIWAISLGLMTTTLRSQEEEYRRTTEESRRVLKTLDALEKEIDRFKRLYSFDLWIPHFPDPLMARVFLMRHLTRTFQLYKGGGVRLDIYPTEEKKGKVSYIRMNVEATFRNFKEMLGLLETLEGRPPLFILEGLECKKEGERISVLLSFRFAYRVQKRDKGA